MGGPVDAGKGATGLGASWVVVLGARRQRLNIPSMHFPANYWLHTAMLAGVVRDDMRRARTSGALRWRLFSEWQDSSNDFKITSIGL